LFSEESDKNQNLNQTDFLQELLNLSHILREGFLDLSFNSQWKIFGWFFCSQLSKWWLVYCL